MPYINIVFLQESEADEAMEILNNDGKMACIEYLSQWDFGDGLEEEDSPWGKADELFQHEDLVLSWNSGLPYVSLTRIVE